MKRKKMNEMDLINNFTKSQLKELLKIQIENENYEGATVVKNAIDQFDECHITGIDMFLNIEDDELKDDDLYNDNDEEK